MHEKSTRYKARDSILNHKKVQDMDPHERQAVAEATKHMTTKELQRKLSKLYE